MKKKIILVILTVLFVLGIYIFSSYFVARPGIGKTVQLSPNSFELLDYDICLYCLPHNFTSADYIVLVSKMDTASMQQYLTMINLPPRTGHHPNIYFVLDDHKKDKVVAEFKANPSDFRTNSKIVAVGKINEYTDDVSLEIK